MSLTKDVARAIALELRAIEQEDEAVEAEAKRLEAEGRIIVDGGSVRSDPCAIREAWEYTDWRTGKVLAAGDKAADDPMSDEGTWPSSWYHIDAIREDTVKQFQAATPTGIFVVEGLPDLSDIIAEAVREWACNHEDAARAWLSSQPK